jgi:hypothetical protein
MYADALQQGELTGAEATSASRVRIPNTLRFKVRYFMTLKPPPLE